MTRLITSGAEIYCTPQPTSGDTAALTEIGAPDGFVTGSTGFVRDTTTKRSGAASFQSPAGGTSGDLWFPFTGVLDRGYYMRCYFKGSVNPTALVSNFFGTDVSGVRLNTSGRVTCDQNAATSAIITDGNWHRIEFFVKPSATQANRAYELRVDGVTVSSGTNQTSDGIAPARIVIGLGQVLYNIDDVALNDDQGTFQNSWPGDGYVLLSKPLSDATVSGWTGGVGGTTNLFDAVNNTPPIGTATETDLTQIESAGGVIAFYKTNLQTPSQAGAGANDSLVVAHYLCCHGEDIATGSKTLALADSSSVNSFAGFAIDDGISFLAGLDSGALGTWPQFWRWRNAFSFNISTGTVGGTSAMNVSRPGVESRVASVCFMGVYFEARPGVAPVSPKPNVISQAAKRAASR